MQKKNNPETKVRGKTSPLLIIIMVLMLTLIGINTYLLWDARNLATATISGASAEAPPQEDDPVFVTISPFTVNLQSDQFGPRLLYTGLTLEVPNEEIKDTLTKNIPQVRNRLLVLLADQQAETITQSTGKKALAQNIIDSLSAPYNNNEEITINDVLFTEFIIQ